jgi:hypothetical protein
VHRAGLVLGIGKDDLRADREGVGVEAARRRAGVAAVVHADVGEA